MSELNNSEMLQLARQWHEKHGRLSAPFLQRKLQVNYSKAIELINLIKNETILNNLRFD
jgi:hypothetical protein